MGKILIMIIDDAEDLIFEDLVNLFTKEKHIKPVNASQSKSHLRYGNIEINSMHRIVKINGENASLTNYEFDILHLLARHPGQVFSKKEIYEQIWNLPYLDAEDNVVSLIHRIRKKIEPDPARPIYILTVWGIGYKFNGALDG